MATSGVPNVSVDGFFNDMLGKLEQTGSDLKAEMDALLNGEELSPEAMMALQYRMSIYNTLVEAANAILTALLNTIKNIVQRMG